MRPQPPPGNLEEYEGRAIHGGSWIRCHAWAANEAAETIARMLFPGRKWLARRRASDGAWEVGRRTKYGLEGTGIFLSIRKYRPPAPEAPPPSHFPVDEADICENNHGGDEQSEAAFDSMSESAAALRAVMYTLIDQRGTFGAITDELEALLGLLNQTASPRMSELKAQERIIWNGERRPTKSGRQAKVFVSARVYEQNKPNEAPKQRA